MWIAIAAVVGLAALLILIKGLQIFTMISAKQPIPVETVTSAVVKEEDWAPILSAVGSISAVQGAVVSAELGGVVSQVAFENGSTAKKGDLLCCSGDLGAAYLGLIILEREKKIFLENPNIKPDLEGEKYVIGRILKPEASKKTIDFFEKEQITPTSMIDISDGLSSEILHICKQSHVGCLLYEEKIPIAEETRNAAYKFELDPTACALSGGEDYELLFTIRPDDHDKLILNENISVIVNTSCGDLKKYLRMDWAEEFMVTMNRIILK